MARPVSIKDETILAAAREVFLERGILATTAEVAERAGVSEGSIFKRFKSKPDLFRAAMIDEHAGEPKWFAEIADLAGKGDVRESLIEIGVSIIAFFRRLMPLMMMSWSNPAPNGLPSVFSGPNPPPLRGVKLIAAFFEAEMRAGRLRHHDPEIVARAFLGSLHNYVFLEIVHRANNELPLPPEMYVRGLVNLLWGGLDPRPTKTAGARHDGAASGPKPRRPSGAPRPRPQGR